MEQLSIKSVAFGGFDKQDVSRCIEQMAGESQQLRAQKEELERKLESVMQEIEALRQQVQEAEAAKTEMEARIAELEPYQAEALELRKEAEALRGDAETYRQVRAHLGNIECEAQKRADALEKATIQSLQRTADLFRQQYQTLMSTFDSTANHVTGELRKMEVNLSQLPRAMDRAGVELNELSAILERKKKGE